MFCLLAALPLALAACPTADFFSRDQAASPSPQPSGTRAASPSPQPSGTRPATPTPGPTTAGSPDGAVTAPPPGSGGLDVGLLIVPEEPERAATEIDAAGVVDLAVDRAAQAGKSDRIWVVRRDSGSFTLVDGLAGELGTFSAGPSPYAVVVDAGGNGWIAHEGGPLARFDALGDPLETRVARLPAGARVAVGDDDSAYYTRPLAGQVVRVSPDGLRTASARVAESLAALAVSGGAIWAADPAGDAVLRLEVDEDGTPALKATIPVGDSPSALAVGPGGEIWVASDPVYVVAPGGASRAAAPGLWPTAVAVAPDGSGWVLERYRHRLVHVSDNLQVLGYFRTGIDPVTVGVDSQGTAWVANAGAGTILRLEAPR